MKFGGANLAPCDFFAANWVPGAANWAPGKCWCSKEGLEMFGAQSHKYSYTTKVKHKYSISVDRIYPIQKFTLENIEVKSILL